MQFINDVVNLTQGQLFLKYLGIWVLAVVVLIILAYQNKK